MTGMRHTFLCLAIALPILSACGGSDPLYNQFNSEAGSVIGKAGYATSHNTRVMTKEDYFGHELGVVPPLLMILGGPSIKSLGDLGGSGLF